MRKPGILVLLLLAASAVFATSQQQMQLRITDPANGLADFTFVYFAQGTMPAYRSPEDVAKSFDTVQSQPQLYSFTSDSIACYANSYGPFTSSTVIALGMRSSMDTTYTISLAGSSNFDPSTLILLEDRELGTFTNLRTAACTIHIYHSGLINNRFYLHVTFPPAVSSVASGCNNNTGMVQVSADSSVAWSSCTLIDSTGNSIKTYNNISGNFNFGGLPGGAYGVIFLYNGYESTKTAQVDGHQVEASISASVVTAPVGQQINFYSATINASNYQWQFGDSTIISGIENPSYAYTNPGYYTVMLTASNTYGCSVSAVVDVDISTATAISNVQSTMVSITSNSNRLRISVSDVSKNNYNYALYNSAGQVFRSGTLTTEDYEMDISGFSSGIYLVSVKGESGVYSKKIIIAR